MACSVETNFILIIWMLSLVITKGDYPTHLEYLGERWEIVWLLLRFLTQINLEKKKKKNKQKSVIGVCNNNQST